MNLKKVFIGLGIFLSVATFAAVAPPARIDEDALQMGNGSRATDKSITFQTGRGNSNANITNTQSSGDLHIKAPAPIHLENPSVKVGNGTAADQSVIFDIGAGASNPFVKWDNATQTLRFSNDGATVSDLGSGSGGGGADYGQLEQTLQNAELGTNSTIIPNQFLDTFNTSLGTVSNLIAQNSGLNFVAGQNSGTYERTKSTSEIMKHVNGKAIYRGQQIAPNNTACSPSCTATAVTLVFTGDLVTPGYFPTGKNVAVCKLSTDDSGTDQICVMDSSNNLGQFSVTSATYSAPNTTVVIANPNALDLSLGLSSSNFNSTLRVEPFDYQIQAKTLAAGTLENLEIRGLHSRGNIGIPGQSPVNTAILSACSITGSALRVDVTASPNGIYEIGRVLEKTASSGNTATYHWAFSINSGVSFTCFATTKPAQDTGNITSGIIDEGYFNGFDNFAVLHNDQTIVANNGKAFLGYTKYHNSTDNRTGFAAAYTDLTAGSPSITDTPATTGDGGQANSLSTTPGWVFYRSDTSLSAHCGGDTTDLSFVACICQSQNETNGDARVRQYTNGGASYSTTNQPLALAQDIVNFGGQKFMDVSGTGVSHRMTVTGNYASDLNTQYADQGAASFNSRVQQESGGDIDLIDSAASGSKQYTLYSNSTNSKVSYMSATVSGTPAYSARRDLIKWGGVDKFYGYNSSDGKNSQKNSRSRLFVDPGNANHLFAILDVVNPDSVTRSTLVEVADDANFVGSLFSCTSNTSNYTNLGDTSSNQKLAAVITTTGASRLRTVSMKFRQVGSIQSGTFLTAYLQTATAASPSGVPTGTIVATSTNAPDASLISKGNGSNGTEQVVYFNFNNVTLSASTNYAIVIVPSFTVSASNYLQTQFANPCGTMGTALAYNGSTWSNLGSTAYQLVMDINGEYQVDVSNAIDVNRSFAGDNIQDQESSIGYVNSTTLQILSRRTFSPTSGFRATSGHPYRRLLTFGSGGALPSVSSATVAGYAVASHDPNLLFNVSLGSSASAQQDTVTGIVSTSNLAEDRSGYGTTASYGAATYGANASFLSGQAAHISGSNFVANYAYPNYTASVSWQTLPSSRPWILEFEMKPNGALTSGDIIGLHNNGSTAGWESSVTSGGALSFITYSAGSPVSTTLTNNGVISSSTYAVVRMWYTGSGIVHIATASSPTGSFTEASYATSQNYSQQTTSNALQIGAASSNPDLFLGYFKIATGVSSFVKAGFFSQPALTDIQNLGTSAFAQSRSGTMNAGTQGTSFDLASLINTGGNTSLVDSYDQDVFVSHDISVPNQGNQLDVKFTAGRGGSTIAPAWMGMIYRFSK